MDRFTVKSKGLKPRVDVFTQKLHTNMKQLWEGATRAFIEEMLKEDTMLVDTGMSRASLLPLSRKVRMLTVARASVGGDGDKKGAMMLEDKKWHPDLTRGPALGEKLGEKAFTLNFGSKDRPVFKFEFHIVVYQHWFHENFGNGGSLKPTSRNMHSLAKGEAAFLDYIKQNAASKVPKLAEWILPG